MTSSAEHITIEFEGEEGVWAPVSTDVFTAGPGAPSVIRQYVEQRRRSGGLAAILLMQSAPTAISSALHHARRFMVRSGLLFPHWTALSIVEAEALQTLDLPDGTHLEVGENACYLHFDDPDHLPLEEDLGLVRCVRSHDGLHWYVDASQRFRRQAERFVSASHGADGIP